MITDSPHLYRKKGLEQGVPLDLIGQALKQALIVENQGLASVLTLNHLAHQTGSSYGYLRNIVARRSDPYFDIVIPRRKSIAVRPISAPKPILMQVQRWLLDNIVKHIPAHRNSFAYTEGRSIKACAQKHALASWLVKMDIRNFFETINEARIYDIFQGVGYQPLPSLELARICTRYAGHAAHINQSLFVRNSSYRAIDAYSAPLLGFLPQGAPTSGALANRVAIPLDNRLTCLADAYGIIYSRYADDITFSSSDAFNRSKTLELIGKVRSIIRSEGFAPHDKKTRIIPPGARKIVLGLLVDGPNVRLSKRMRSRIIFHVRGVENFGLSKHVAHVRFSSIEGLVRHVGGLLAFAADIEPDWAITPSNRWHAALRGANWI
jgi:RNA-directed DNA polymerase